MSRIKRALQMPSGALYESGAGLRERWAIFQNARLDLIELLAEYKDDAQAIAIKLSLDAYRVSQLLGIIEERSRGEATQQPPGPEVAP